MPLPVKEATTESEAAAGLRRWVVGLDPLTEVHVQVVARRDKERLDEPPQMAVSRTKLDSRSVGIALAQVVAQTCH